MNQICVFFIFVWLMVVVLLWMEWSCEKVVLILLLMIMLVLVVVQSVLGVVLGSIFSVQVLGVLGQVVVQVQVSVILVSQCVIVIIDVLCLVFDGGCVFDVELLQFLQIKDEGSLLVCLLIEDFVYLYSVISGWVSEDKNILVFGVDGFKLVGDIKDFVLVKGQNELQILFVWIVDNGVIIKCILIVLCNEYVVCFKDEVSNVGIVLWNGYVYCILDCILIILLWSMINLDFFSFNGVIWYDNDKKYQCCVFKDYLEDGMFNQNIIGGWLVMLQYYFFIVWILQKDQIVYYVLLQVVGCDLIEVCGLVFIVVLGQFISIEVWLWVGLKLVNLIVKEDVLGLDCVVDYSCFLMMVVIGQGLFWVLNQVYKLVGNWGWVIVGLVVLLKLVLYLLLVIQYKSGVKMCCFQLCIVQLKECYGDDCQKFQIVMMELYKKEKINLMGGCLLIFIQMLIFFVLYWVLVELVELCQVFWFGWIQDFIVCDLYFILLVINVVVMWFIQKLILVLGMDLMQQKMMQFMLLVFGVMMVFMLFGLVLYWVVNGGLGLLQQWWMIKCYGGELVLVIIVLVLVKKK